VPTIIPPSGTLAHLASNAARQKVGKSVGTLQDGRAPILLTTGVLSLASGAVAVAPTSQLVPPYRSPYLIRELRFTAQSPVSTENFQNYNLTTFPAYFLQAQLAVGRTALTKNFVPICNLAPSVQSIAEASVGGYNYDSSGTQGNYLYSMFRWVFPQPMYVQPGDGLIASFQRISTDNIPGNCTIECAVVGEILPYGQPEPAYTCAPYVAAYNNYETAFANSQAFDLPNPWPDKEFYLQRLIGRFWNQVNGNSPNPPSFVVGNNETESGTASALITITDEDRFPITPAGGLYFGECFDVRTHALEHRRVMPPAGWLQLNFNQAYTSEVSYWVSMVGWRKERLL
jgi:hypothetical protein